MTDEYTLSKSRVEWLMRKNGLESYGDLANATGVDLRSIMRWVNHETQIKASDAVRLATVLATSVDYLMGKSEDATPLNGPKLFDVDLTDEERELIIALRRRQADRAIQAFAALSKTSK